tara:strand:+ start:60 stop:914 length:855 start_codon:yes stop_codon:yes gene_type:complete
MSFTYTTLKSAIQDYTDNSEFVFLKNMPNFVKAAEDRIFEAVDLEYFRKNVTSAMTASDQFLSVPDDLLAVFSLQITTSGSENFLLQKDVNYLREFTPNASTTGVPKYYAVFSTDHFLIAPTPVSNFTVELHYYYRPTSLAQSTTTLTVNTVVGTFTTSDIITGGTSGFSTTVSAVPSSTTLTIIIPGGDFTVGETITGSSSGATASVISTSPDSTTTWISDNAPNVLLYGALFEAYTFMKGEQDVIAIYEKRFMDGLTRLKELGEARENYDAYRTGLPTRPRT